MALLTLSEALQILSDLPNNPQYQGVDGLTKLVENTIASDTAASSNAVSMFFSGSVGNVSGVNITYSIVGESIESAAISDSSQMVTAIGYTPAAELLTSPQFEAAMNSAAQAAGLTSDDVGDKLTRLDTLMKTVGRIPQEVVLGKSNFSTVSK